MFDHLSQMMITWRSLTADIPWWRLSGRILSFLILSKWAGDSQEVKSLPDLIWEGALFLSLILLNFHDAHLSFITARVRVSG